MKTAAVRFKIVGRPGEWTVVEKATEKIVWTGKTYRNARTAHAMHERGVSWAKAQRAGNA